jgi:hypothetical protein
MVEPGIQSELELIEALVSGHPQGVSATSIASELRELMGAQINQRTLQRRLKKLLKQGRLLRVGSGRAQRYRPNQSPAASPPLATKSTTKEGQTEAYVPLSAEGLRARELVSRPLMQRIPVGYRREFLDAYQPGANFYLSEALRRQLHEIGRTPAGERPAGTYAREILSRLLVDLSWASSKLEGNTYTRLDTQNLIEFGQIAQGKDAIETQMILNHKAAIEMLIEDADEVGIDAFTFKNLHSVLSQDLMRDPEASGRLRRRPVEISGTVYHPLALPQTIEDCFHELLDKAAAIKDPFEQAFFLMVQIPYLQPFEDVNKRVSRIGANIPLIKYNLCPLSFIDVPEASYVEGTLSVYELNNVDLLRDVFVWAYERSCQRYLAITQSLVEPDPLKIKYREALIKAIQKIVRGKIPASEESIELAAKELANPEDEAAFADMLKTALHHLHEGGIARYRLRRSEYLAWKQSEAGSKNSEA